jgi:hypothetical protein
VPHTEQITIGYCHSRSINRPNWAGENHPLKALMEVVGALIENYETDNIPELGDNNPAFPSHHKVLACDCGSSPVARAIAESSNLYDRW